MTEQNPTTPGMATLAMIMSAYDQIAMNRRCDRHDECSRSSMGYRRATCQCYHDATNRVERDMQNDAA